MAIEHDADFLRAISNCYLNQPLKKALAPEVYHRMLAVLGRHHSYAKVVKASAVAQVCVCRNASGGSGRTFKVISSYGDHIVLSQSEIFTPADPYTALEQAARAAIQPQIAEAARKFWSTQEKRLGYDPAVGVPCPVNPTVTIIKRQRKTWDVDHWGAYTTFSLLLKQWVREHNIRVEGINFNHNRTRFAAASRHHEEHWAEFHRRHAVLKVISSNANRAKGGAAGFADEKRRWKQDHPHEYKNIQLTESK